MSLPEPKNNSQPLPSLTGWFACSRYQRSLYSRHLSPDFHLWPQWWSKRTRSNALCAFGGRDRYTLRSGFTLCSFIIGTGSSASFILLKMTLQTKGKKPQTTLFGWRTLTAYWELCLFVGSDPIRAFQACRRDTSDRQQSASHRLPRSRTPLFSCNLPPRVMIRLTHTETERETHRKDKREHDLQNSCAFSDETNWDEYKQKM